MPPAKRKSSTKNDVAVHASPALTSGGSGNPGGGKIGGEGGATGVDGAVGGNDGTEPLPGSTGVGDGLGSASTDSPSAIRADRLTSAFAHTSLPRARAFATTSAEEDHHLNARLCASSCVRHTDHGAPCRMRLRAIPGKKNYAAEKKNYAAVVAGMAAVAAR